MNEKTSVVFAGWLKLTESERDELQREIQRYRLLQPSQKKLQESRAYESAVKITLGPLPGGCPCCGK